MSDWNWHDDEYQDSIASKMSRCRDCESSIVWLKTKNGKKIAVETDDCNGDDELFDRNRHKCHWDVCRAKNET